MVVMALACSPLDAVIYHGMEDDRLAFNIEVASKTECSVARHDGCTFQEYSMRGEWLRGVSCCKQL